MITLTKKIVFLVILLTIFFNIERIDAQQENFINMNSLVYIFGLVGAVVPFLIPVGSRFRVDALILLILGGYIVCADVLQTGDSLWDRGNIYLSLGELAFLAAIVSLAHSIAGELSVLLRQSEAFSVLGQPFACPTLEAQRSRIEAEIIRCRRYERSLGIIVIEPQYARDGSNTLLHPVISKSLVMRAVSHVLQRHIRRPDWIVDDVAKHRLVIICPESDCRELEEAIVRLDDALYSHLDVTVNIGYAAFPSDAVTLEGLFSVAQSRLPLSSGEKELQSFMSDSVSAEPTNKPAIVTHYAS